VKTSLRCPRQMVGVKTSLRHPCCLFEIIIRIKISLGENLFEAPKADSRSENLIEAPLLSLRKKNKKKGKEKRRRKKQKKTSLISENCCRL